VERHSLAQARLVVAVGAWVSYWSPQVDNKEHTRSEVAVGAWVSYWSEEIGRAAGRERA
jgi:hypothetical protein